MTFTFCGLDVAEIAQFAGAAGQVCTTVLVATLAALTFRHQKRQSALTLINNMNALANQVNTTVIQSPDARAALGRLVEPIVGCPDDAILFMYLNYAHNTFRCRVAGAVTSAVWRDTLDSCANTMARLRRDQLERLLSRGYEAGFRERVLARYDRLRRDRLAREARTGVQPGLALAASPSMA